MVILSSLLDQIHPASLPLACFFSTMTMILLIDFPGQVIDSYSVPEASWILGPWDTTACDAGCEGAMEVVQLSCSRGSWLLCSGISKSMIMTDSKRCADMTSGQFQEKHGAST
jgi:hypothetical protein